MYQIQADVMIWNKHDLPPTTSQILLEIKYNLLLGNKRIPGISASVHIVISVSHQVMVKPIITNQSYTGDILFVRQAAEQAGRRDMSG